MRSPGHRRTPSTNDEDRMSLEYDILWPRRVSYDATLFPPLVVEIRKTHTRRISITMAFHRPVSAVIDFEFDSCKKNTILHQSKG